MIGGESTLGTGVEEGAGGGRRDRQGDPERAVRLGGDAVGGQLVPLALVPAALAVLVVMRRLLLGELAARVARRLRAWVCVWVIER